MLFRFLVLRIDFGLDDLLGLALGLLICLNEHLDFLISRALVSLMSFNI